MNFNFFPHEIKIKYRSSEEYLVAKCFAATCIMQAELIILIMKKQEYQNKINEAHIITKT